MRKYIVVHVGPAKPSCQLCEKFPHTDVYKVVALGEAEDLNRLARILNGIEEAA